MYAHGNEVHKKVTLFGYYRSLAKIHNDTPKNVILLYISPKEVACEGKILPKLKKKVKAKTEMLNQTFHVGIIYSDFPCIIHQNSLDIIKH